MMGVRVRAAASSAVTMVVISMSMSVDGGSVSDDVVGFDNAILGERFMVVVGIVCVRMWVVVVVMGELPFS